MPQTPDGDYYILLGTGLPALRDSGLLYVINEFHCHGRGHEVRIAGNELRLFGDGRSNLEWKPEDVEAVDKRRRQARQTFLDAEQFNWHGHYEGHSPGFGGKRSNPQPGHGPRQIGAGR